MEILQPMQAGSTFYGRGGQYIKSFPAAETMTPEATVNKQIQTGRQQIQDKYALQWKEVNRSARFLGQTKQRQMLRQIDANAKREMLQFNQQAKAQMAQLQRIDTLAEQGLINNPDQIKARMVFGSDVAASMYPEPQKERPVPQQFGELDVYSHRIDQELERFQMADKRVPALLRRAGKFGWPVMPKEKKKQELQTMDYDLPSGVKDKFGDPVMGKWRKATEDEAREYQVYKGEQQRVSRLKQELLAIPSIGRRVVQPGTAGGTFGDKVADSIRKPTAVKQQRQQPTATELRRQGTREAYEKGKQLGYWQ